MLYCLEKAGKIAAALGAPPLNPHWPPTPKLLFPLNLRVILSTAQISRHRQNYILLSHT